MIKRLAALTALATLLVTASAQARKPVMVGVAGDSAQVTRIRAAGVPVGIRATFEAWSLDRTPDAALAVNRSLHARTMITWEPWEPTGPAAPNAVQPRFSPAAIAAGRRNAYIRRFARALKAQKGTVYLRFAHEMNGRWYPWSLDAAGYRRAWRHVWRQFHAVGARNVKFVWSSNLNTFQTDDAYAARLRTFWPGKRYVDIVGTSLVRLRTQGDRGIAWSFARMETLRHLGRPVMLTEVKVDLEEAPVWLFGLRCALASRPWIAGLVWSETPSRAAARDPRVGNMNWSLADQPFARGEMRRIAAGRAC